MELKIYNQSGAEKATVSPASSSGWSREVGVENVVSLSFKTWSFFLLDVNDYILLGGSKFRIRKEYRPKQISTQEYDYRVNFYGREHDAEDIKLCRFNQGDDDLEVTFAYEATPLEMLTKVVQNLNRNTDGTVWKAGEALDAPRQTFEFNDAYCWDALNDIASQLETEWWMDGDYVNLCKCERGESVSLGYMRGLTSLTQQENSNDVRFFTRLIPRGSTKNIDRGKYGFDRLQLPSRAKYLDLNTKLGLKEHVEETAFAEIYPHRTGTISAVRSEEKENEETGKFTVYYIKDKDLPFNPDEHMLGSQVIHITFQSGNLQGKDFECNWHNDTQEFEIVNTYPDEDSQLPGGNLIPGIGNTYILWNLRMPDEYITAAERDYETAVTDFLSEYARDTSIYQGSTDYIYVDKNSVPLVLGQRVRLLSPEYFDETGYRDSRITRISCKLENLSSATIDCCNATGRSWKSSVESSLSNMKYTIAEQLKQGTIKILKNGDTETPSEYNVFSALRSMAEFISKTRPDVAKEVITFLKGAKFGSDQAGKPIFIIGNEIKTSNFTEGDLGSGLVIKTLDNGNSYIEVDELFVRKLAYFIEVVIKRLTHVGGEIILSPASMTCSRVEDFEGYYRCFFEKEDNNRSIVQEFKANDQARSQTFNIQEGTSHNIGNTYYWRLVVGTGEDYIDLSKTDCDRGSTVPAVGDYIIQLGNRTDSSRQNAQILSSYGSDAPSYKQYKGIDSYCLDGKEMAKISPSGNRIVGDFILSTGVGVATQFTVLENLISSEIASVRKEIVERDNILSNASFSEHTLGWETVQAYTPYTVGEKYLFFFGKPYTWRKAMAGISTVDGKNTLRIKQNSIKQYNKNFAFHPAFDLIKKMIVDVDGNPVLDDKGTPTYKTVKEARMFSIEFYYRPISGGNINVGFSGTDKSGFEAFDEIGESISLAPSASFIKHTITGMWNGTGDFVISCTGDMYIHSLIFTEDKFADIEYRYSTKFEQTDKLISLNASEIKETNDSLNEKYTELSVTAEGISAKISSNYTTLNSKIDSKYSDALWWADYNLSATADTLRSEFSSGIDEVELAYSRLEQTVNGISTTVAGNKSDADKAIATINTTLGNLNSGLTAAQKDIVDANGTLSTVQKNLSGITGRLGAVESNYVTTTALQQTNNAIAAQASKWDSLGALVSQAGFVLSSEASGWYVAKGNVISAINLTPEYATIEATRINMKGVATFSSSTARNSSVWIEGSAIMLYSSDGTSRYMKLGTGYSNPEISMYNGTDVMTVYPHQMYIVRSYYGTTFGAYSNGKIDIRADSWPTAANQVNINGVYVDGTTLRVRAN